MVQEEDRNKHLDVNVFRGSGGKILEHHLVVARIGCLLGWEELGRGMK